MTNDLEMRLGKGITDELERENMVVFESSRTGQLYVLMKLKDEKGAVAKLAQGLYTVKTKDALA